MRQQFFWRGKRVPYTTVWTAEQQPQPTIIRRIGQGGEGIGYADERPFDRRDEALWVRSGLAQGRGKPDFVRMNTHRQKRAIRYDLCQVCGEIALGTETYEGALYLVGGAVPIAEGETTTAPPVHPLCAVESIENCPPLGRGWAAALVKRSPLWGVAGQVHDPVTLQPVTPPERRPGDELQHVYIGDELIRWTLASFSVVSLHGVTAVSEKELYALAQEEARQAMSDDAEPAPAMTTTTPTTRP